MSDDKVAYPETPMLERLSSVSDVSNQIGEFIGWLRDEKDIELCEDYPVPEGGYGTDGGFHPTHQRVEALLAGFFEIDLGQVEAERRAILDFLSEQQG